LSYEFNLKEMSKGPNVLLLLLFFNLLAYSQNLDIQVSKVAILADQKKPEENPELQELSRYLSKSGQEVSFITPKQIEKSEIPSQFNIIWIIKNDSLPIPKSWSGKMMLALKDYTEAGGKIVLANQASVLLKDLGLEDIAPVTRLKPAIDEGYGRQLGYHAFLVHPLFDRMNGGAYVLKPLKDTTVMQTGYFGDEVPAHGKVIAVDWDYIFLRENSKLILEYNVGKGKVLAVGGYLIYDMPNRNRMHLLQFTQNIVNYMTVTNEYAECHYWDYEKSRVIDTNFRLSIHPVKPLPFKPIKPFMRNLVISPGKSTGNYWDLAGERMLAMGTDHGGITEIWAHPVMCMRDYRVSVMMMKDKGLRMQDLGELKPDIIVDEAVYTRKYKLGDRQLEESISVAPDRPVTVIHYACTGNKLMQMSIDFRLLFRLMWPYSEKVLGNMYYSWDENLPGIIVTDESGIFVTIVGIVIDRDSIADSPRGLHLTHSEALGKDLKQLDMPVVDEAIGLSFTGKVSFSVIIASSSGGLASTFDKYLEVASDPSATFTWAQGEANRTLQGSVQIESPDTSFNQGYDWALLATDRFMVNTPGIGASLTAGYATSDRGWDGEQEVSGRPGYGWYFGRDGEWSGFALLDYGDFEKVRQMLETFCRYQDLNGKIFHELSTSGIAHYDAADATPLFIVLAGRYLHHSGDTAFIRRYWWPVSNALAYCYSTDTDGDLLIENTNVGHGWEEGGHLFGCHTTLYLASCWAEALDQAAYMADATGRPDLAKNYRNDARTVKSKINSNFWNPETGYYYHGLMPDGSYKPDISIMPTIPMLFGQVDKAKAADVLPVIATNSFTADWGCRIVPENDPHFNPAGYHTGSVWPLFTGWAALAEFRYRNYLQGYSHLSSNLMIWKYWGLGFNEEVLNGEIFEPSGVCHHQCWSETMALEPAIEGMLGFRPDAVNHILSLSPWFPMDWEKVDASGIRIGVDTIRMTFVRNRQGDKGTGGQGEMEFSSIYMFDRTSGERLDVHFQPVLPPGSVVEKITVNGQPAREWGVRPSPQGWEVVEFGFWLDSTAAVEITWHGGISALPIVSSPQPGDRSEGFRIISTSFADSSYTVTLQGPRASSKEFSVWASEPHKVLADGAVIHKMEGNIITLTIDFPDLETDYATKTVTFSIQ
jgi:glycogen debranching enzyme